MAFARKRLRDAHLAEDVVQESLVKAHLVASSGRSVTVRQSDDLKGWGQPKTGFTIVQKIWGGDAIWTPEMHA